MKTHYTIEGTPNSPVLAFSNSLGTAMHMWDKVVPLLLPYFRILRYDTRGHGQSEVTTDPYSIAQLGQDVIDLLDELNLDKVHFCGISMGGQIGQYLGIHHKNRLNKLVLCNTAAQIGTKKNWNDRINILKEKGMQAIWEGTKQVWFRDVFIQNNPALMEMLAPMFLCNNVAGYSNCCAAIRDADFTNDLQKISQDTLIIAGIDDPATTVADAEFMHKKIADSSLAVLPARHIPCIEQAEQFANTLVEFLVGKTTFEKGMHVRRTVLGEEHVNRANKNKNPFTEDFQDFISHYAWGEIWTRPGLSKHNRSLITLSMMIALNRREEFKMHIKAAIHNGLTPDEIKELILQSGIYCGLPAANDAFHAATEVFKNLNIDVS